MSAPALSDEDAPVLEAMLARLIPADELGPGAIEAGVMGYVQAALGAWHGHTAPAYGEGLAALQELARTEHGSDFPACTADAQDELLARLARDEATKAFFELARTHAIEGMFGDPRWGGNGDHAGWKLLGYPGPRPQWTHEEQQIVAIDRGTASA